MNNIAGRFNNWKLNIVELKTNELLCPLAVAPCSPPDEFFYAPLVHYACQMSSDTVYMQIDIPLQPPSRNKNQLIVNQRSDQIQALFTYVRFLMPNHFSSLRKPSIALIAGVRFLTSMSTAMIP